jgi:hypothetical protein
MYSWLFRQLPGPFWLRILLSAALLAGVLLVLFEVACPWVADMTHLTDSTVG